LSDRYWIDNPYNLCRQPLYQRSNVSASSELTGRTAQDARLHSGSAWSAKESDFYQYLVFDLGQVMNVTAIVTQGRLHTDDFVEEFRIQYGTNGRDFTDYKEVDGHPKLFDANIDGLGEKRNTFDEPIIAQWIRINPTRWADRIAMRVELYGCEYISDTLYFDGNAMLSRDLHKEQISSKRETIRFRMKTTRENGVLLYARGTQGDYLALQLVENRLLLNINLGSSRGRTSDTETSLTLGSLLDDNNFHEVHIERERRNIVLSVDRVQIRDRIRGEFNRLDLDGNLYIGGAPYVQRGLVIYDNFTGCIENLYLNHTNVIAAFKTPFLYKDDVQSYEEVGKTSQDCFNDPFTIPITFRTSGSYVKQIGFERSRNFNFTLEFRTFEQNGLLMYHKFSSVGYVKLYLEHARIKVRIASKDMPEVEIDNFDQTFSDGIWHTLDLSMGPNRAIISVDKVAMETSRKMDISTGSYYYIGGGLYATPGFVGCMRHITIDGQYKLPTDWKKDEISNRDDVIIESCQMHDRCNPNPCEHGGICKQSSEDFYCECEHTGYAGKVCHTSLNWMSCIQFQNAHPDSRFTETILDIDGSGPIPPIPVQCEFFSDGRNITYITHEQMASKTVDGFEAKGSYREEIQYHAPMEMMEALINRSDICVQKLGYNCKRSRLLNTPVGDSEEFSPFGWWVSRQNKKMDYWAGSLPGSRKCECGLTGDCYDVLKWCNCDSGRDDWLYDGGELKEKEYLPVRSLHFGDTGTPLDRKEGRYNLGPLECRGDRLFSDQITFRKADAALILPPFQMEITSGDIFFEFKTSTQRTMVLLHSVGLNGDFIKVSMISGDSIQFEFSVGKGIQGVTVETQSRLDDNKWHSVLIEKNRKEAVVIIDGAQKTEVPEPAGPVRPFKFGRNSKLYVGATKDLGDGYVGCLRALVLNGVPVDLHREYAKFPYGLSKGCKGKCAKNPCKNGGECMEGYDSFTCNCRWTPFKGPICADEIGINFRTNTMVKYDFKGKYKSTIQERIHVGFTTTNPQGFLMGLFSDISKEYLTLMVSTSGHIRLVFDFGFERQEIVFGERSFLTGQYHDVVVERYNEGKNLRMIIDNYAPLEYDFSNSLKASADAQFDNIQYLYIGKNETMTDGFVGCISRVEFDEIIPLKLYFQEDPHGNIKSEPATLTDSFCGIEPVTNKPDELETRPPPVVDKEKLERFYSRSQSVIMGVALSIIFGLLVLVCFAIGKYLNRHKGDYYTKEDDGAQDAFDADTAVLQGRTGHQVQRKKEWFI